MARASKAQANQSRRRIVVEAARLFRERGYDGVGLADIMDAAGMTHGGFYRHFESKSALFAEACDFAFLQSAEDLMEISHTSRQTPFAEAVRRYVSPSHCNAMGEACPLTTLSLDASRSANPSVRQIFTDAVGRNLETISSSHAVDSATITRNQAVATLTQMVGAVILARAVDDPELAAEIIEVTRDNIIRNA